MFAEALSFYEKAQLETLEEKHLPPRSLKVSSFSGSGLLARMFNDAQFYSNVFGVLPGAPELTLLIQNSISLQWIEVAT